MLRRHRHGVPAPNHSDKTHYGAHGAQTGDEGTGRLLLRGRQRANRDEGAGEAKDARAQRQKTTRRTLGDGAKKPPQREQAKRHDHGPAPPIWGQVRKLDHEQDQGHDRDHQRVRFPKTALAYRLDDDESRQREHEEQ